MITRIQKNEKKPFKQLINELLRIGLMQKTSAQVEKNHFSTPELSTGPCSFADLDNIAEVLAVAEKEEFT